jgi:hypothetical protein
LLLALDRAPFFDPELTLGTFSRQELGITVFYRKRMENARMSNIMEMDVAGNLVAVTTILIMERRCHLSQA